MIEVNNKSYRDLLKERVCFLIKSKNLTESEYSMIIRYIEYLKRKDFNSMHNDLYDYEVVDLLEKKLKLKGYYRYD